MPLPGSSCSRYPSSTWSEREARQRLSVVNRILRHDLRNKLNVVAGNAERIRGQLDRLDTAAGLRDGSETTTAVAELAQGTDESEPEIRRLQALIDEASAFSVEETPARADRIEDASGRLAALADRSSCSSGFRWRTRSNTRPIVADGSARRPRRGRTGAHHRHGRRPRHARVGTGGDQGGGGDAPLRRDRRRAVDAGLARDAARWRNDDRRKRGSRNDRHPRAAASLAGVTMGGRRCVRASDHRCDGTRTSAVGSVSATRRSHSA